MKLKCCGNEIGQKGKCGDFLLRVIIGKERSVVEMKLGRGVALGRREVWWK